MINEIWFGFLFPHLKFRLSSWQCGRWRRRSEVSGIAQTPTALAFSPLHLDRRCFQQRWGERVVPHRGILSSSARVGQDTSPGPLLARGSEADKPDCRETRGETMPGTGDGMWNMWYLLETSGMRIKLIPLTFCYGLWKKFQWIILLQRKVQTEVKFDG